MTSRSITLAIILFFRNIIESTLIMASGQNVSPASTVMTTQEHYPTESSALQYFILEELPAGTLVGNVPRDFQLNERYTPPAADGSFQFRFLSRAGLVDRKLFDIDPSTGIIRTLERLDREDICSQRREVINIGKSPIAADAISDDLAVSDDIIDIECFFVVDVAVQPMRFFRIIRVRIEIIDVNDNSPTFPFPIVEHRISETAELGTSLLIDPAVDRDAGVNGECEYRLDTAADGVCASDDGNSSTGSGNKFQLTVDMQSNGDVRLKLVLVEPLDRETCDYFKFAIVAVDGGHTVRRTGSMVIDVRITDANDNAPEFRPKSHFRVMVVENSSAGYPVLRLSAIDRDVGQNAELHYSFVEQSATEFGHVFGIEPETGLIYTHRPLDRETPPETYRLYVVVHDSGGPEAEGALSAHALVEVHVTDVNDNAPTICMRPPAWNTASSVPNRHSKKTSDDVVRRLGATAASRGGNSSAEECRTDYDQQGFLTYTVGSEIGNSGDVIIFVAHVTVHDADAGNNSRFDCMLVGRDAGSFELRRIYVTEYVIVVDDGEEDYPDGVRDFSIVCRDYGRPETKTSSVDVRVVLPSNRLQFNSGLFHAAIDENNAVGTALIQLNVAEITDATIRSRVHYRLVASNQNDDEVLDLVDIDPVSGLVTARKSFDRERGSTFDFTVMAEVPDRRRRGNQQDTTGNTATTRVIVTIRDVDDEHPRFDRKLYSFRVSENQLAGAKVGYLTAVDRDTFPFNRIVYSIDPTADQVFGVDPTSGLLFARHPLDREAQSVYHAVATAASPSTSTHPFGDDLTTLHVDTAEIDVIVDDVNDHRPVFKSLTVGDDHVVTENVVHVRSIDTVSIGDVVTTVTATDADAGRNAHLIYRIVGVRMIISGVERSLHISPASASSQQRSPEFFRIDPEGGTITVAPDFRSATSNLVNGGASGEFLVEVSASDLGVPPLSASMTLRLVVEPSTDFAIIGQRRTYVNDDSDDVIDDSGANVSGSTLHDDDLLMMATFGLTAFAASACLIGIVFFASRKRRNRQCQRRQPQINNGQHYHSVRLDELSSEAEPSAECAKRQQRKRGKRRRKQKEIDDEFGQEWKLPSSRDEARMNGRTKIAPGSSVLDKSSANSKVTRYLDDSSPSRSHVNKVTSSSAVVGNEYVVAGSTVRKTHVNSSLKAVKAVGGNAKEDLKPLATVRPAISATSSMAAAERDGWRNCTPWSRHLESSADATVAPLPITGVCYDHFSKTIPVDFIELSECNELENISNDVIMSTLSGARGIVTSPNPSFTLNGVLGDVKRTDAPYKAPTAATALCPQTTSALSSNVNEFETTTVDCGRRQRDDRQVQFAVSSKPVVLRGGEPLLSYSTPTTTSGRHQGPSSASGVNVSPLPTSVFPTTHSIRSGADNSAEQTTFGSRQRSASDDDIERRLRWTVQSRLPPSLRCDIEDLTTSEAEAEETGFQGSTLPPSYRHREISNQPAANKSNATAADVASTSDDRNIISLPTQQPASVLLGRQYVESMTSYPVRCTGRQLYSPATAANADTYV